MRKSGISLEQVRAADLSLLTESYAVDILRLVAQYPDVTNNTLKTLEPTNLLNYLFRLTHQLSSSYSVLRVIGNESQPAIAHARAALFEAARQTLNNGMKLLGLSPVERM
ncbi:MAG: hypothetical protein M4579_006395 [Chaenotheca gracillima]|nr:MAG: hypothetical protein M4579_006395 [Chaenotheca gracillima]